MRRNEDPERFRRLTRARLRGAVLGLLLSLGGATVAAVGLLYIAGGPLWRLVGR
ncbi:MAG: hypothetical protein JSR45_14950 [Proteobacteria bacterium]|nr:hypothetical protein [Pseudomonadota bacterium]